MSVKGVSVIIVNWNGIKWLERLLNSLEVQTYEKFEIVFVDNNSTDASIAYVQKNFPNVKVVESGVNGGFAKGNSLGISHAKYDNILLLNTDAWVRPDFIRKLINFYYQNDYDVIAPVEASYDGKHRSKYVTTIDLLGHPVYKYGDYDASVNMFLSGVSVLFDKSLYVSSGGLDTDFFMYFEEIDWFWRLKLLGYTFAYDYEVNVYHAGGGSTGTKLLKYNSFLWRNENVLQMIIKNYSGSMLVVLIPLYLLQNLVETLIFFLAFKPQISKSYIYGIRFNIVHIKSTWGKHKLIQKKRKVNDLEILKIMYHGSGKLKHLIYHLKRAI